MTDRLLARTWWLLTMSLIAITASGAMLLAYRGVFSAFGGAYVTSAVYVLGTFPLGIACWFLCRHRSDLVCD
ncbi:MAG: hypothetical protein H7Z14_07000 [Anaerolineae bacterium]|nr:hypothetical protein [Phycisphaerae bacterium]